MKALRLLAMLLVSLAGPLVAPARAGNTVGAVVQNAVQANANGAVVTVFGTFLVASYTISGTFVATVNFEGAGQDGTFLAIGCVPVTGGAAVSSATTTGVFRCNIAGLIQIRARVSGYTSGSVTVSVQASDTGTVLVGPQSDVVSDTTFTNPTTFTTSITVGSASPTAITNIRVYSQALTPSEMAASIAFAEQTFTVTGLTTTDKVMVNPGGAQGAQCAFTGTARVSAASTLALTFFNSAALLCTPASSTYVIVAIRS